MYLKTIILFLPGIFNFCLCEVTEEKRVKLLSDFINYYNLQPNHDHSASDGYLQSIREIDPTTYRLEVSFAVQKHKKRQMMKCAATVQELRDGISLVNNDMYCSEVQMLPAEEDVSAESAEDAIRRPVTLENEIEAGASTTSGEQFIAIPRDQPSAPCIGCSLHVNPQAVGVTDLASLGIRHLDLHEPNVRHSLQTVIDVERQVQVVNGVRYILTLAINFNNCTEENSISDACDSVKTCLISILVKPWQTLPSGDKYRAILANNCTKEWQFGDNGEVLPELTDNRDQKPKDDNVSSDVDVVKFEHHKDIQSKPNQESTLTADELRTLEEQILPHDAGQHNSGKKKNNMEILQSNDIEIHKTSEVKAASSVQYDNNIPATDTHNQDVAHITQDKKKTIDEMLDFLNFSGFKARPREETEGMIPRVKRSYDYDLQILSLTEDFRDLKKSIENAKYIYEMAQTMVDYLNEIDMEVKNRAVKNVLKAEEEEENNKRFVYIQAKVVIPCSMANCDVKTAQTKICNGVIDATIKNQPHVLNTFCYIDTKEFEVQESVKEVPFDDPVLLRLTKEVLRKIESESLDQNAIKIKEIVAANTRIESGRVTKISIILERLDCNKSVPLVFRNNCSTIQYSGSNICEVIVHEKHWLKEKKISYTCTERPIDMIITKPKYKQYDNNLLYNDPKIIEILAEVLQYLEMQSNKKNKQKIEKINKFSTQIIAGFLINLEFDVGYTNCTHADDMKLESENCELLKEERLRKCKAQIWDRSWIVDGRQIEVSCDDKRNKRKEFVISREKRQILTGSAIDADSSDSKYKLLAEESLQKYILESGTSQPHKVDKVEKVTTQIVAGSMTRIDFVASPTDSSTSNTLQCHSEIWEKPWEKFKRITVSCQKANDRIKRGVPGGLEEVSASDPKYKLLAEESLQKYVLESGTSQPLKVVRVVKVTHQIVAGTMTRIVFEAAPTDSSTSNTLQCHSEIWEKSWEHFKQITVSCQKANDRMKRGVPGGLEEVSASDPKYKLLAEESLQKYVLESGTSQPHKVVRVVKVTLQIVEGTMTRIDFEAAPTDSSTSNTLQCHSEIWEKSWENFKQITVSCQKVNGRLKRGTDKTLVGGLEEADASDPKYKLLAEESLQKYLTESDTSLPHKVDKVEKVTTQVVAGSMTRIDFVASPTDSSTSNTLQCHSEIWEKSWENFKQITVSCQKVNGRLKRETDKTLVGGLEEADASDPKYKLLAEESLQKYLTESGTSQPHKVDKVEKVTTQLVAGSMTRIDFVASPTDSSTSNTLQCHSEIWEKPWEHFKQITVSCQKANDRMKRGVPGGLEEVSASDPKYKLLAEESLQKYVLESGTSQPHKVVRVVKVTLQIVEGTMTRIDFEAAPTDSSTSNTLQCHSKIWEKSWENFKQITVSCQKANDRMKRGVPGGLEVESASDPKYKLLAEESLQKYVLESGTSQPLKVVRVVKVTHQIVAGTMTRIVFEAAPTDSSTSNSLQCHSEIWEKSWEHFKQITVSCQKANDRMKRGVPGGLEEVSASDPKYKLLAEESLQKYVLESGTSQPHKVVRVVKVTLQIVEGTMTRIDFEAAPTDSSTSNTLQCHSEIWEKSWENFKQITVSCQKVNGRLKRGTDKTLVGGLEEADASDPKYKLLAEESLQKYLTESGTSLPHKVDKVEKVTTQVVAGSMTRIDFVASPTDSSTSNTLQCHSEIWEKQWEKVKQITVSCRKASDRMKRGVPGGLEEVSASDPKYKLLAEESLQKYVLESGTSQPHKVVRVVKVTHQIVAGTMTRIDFEAAPTVSSTSNTLQCHSEIWEKSWENFKQITVSCQKVNGRLKRGTDKTLVGGLEEADASDPKYKLLAEESLQKYLTESGTSQPHKVDKVEKVTTQLVAGSMTRIDFVASPTVSSTSNTLQCHSAIWEKPWEHFKQITVSCQKANDRMKRGVPGGLEEVSASDPKYKLLAEESLQKYVLESGTSQPHKVVRVVKVTLQIVEGTMTRIDFEAAPTDSSTSNTLQCHSKIWEKSWENFKQITVSCQKANDRMKRGVPGGLEIESASDPKYKLLAEESLQKYILESGTSQPHKVVRVVKVTHQIVAGTMTRIDFEAAPTDSSTSNTLQCHSEIWEKSWENFKQITVSCQKVNGRLKRGTDKTLVGGLEEADASDPKYKLLAEESLQKYLTESGTSLPHKVDKVEKVTTQVVAGSMTRIDFVASPTDSSTSNTLQCHSEIWEKSWENFKQITVSCQKVNGRLKRGTDKTLVGGLEEADASDPKYKLLAEESLQKYLTESGISLPHKVDKVEKVTTQLVAGSMTRIDFVASPTVSSTSNTLQCHSEIWEKPWEHFKQITVSCQKANDRMKRGVPGGLEEVSASDSKYKLLAEESLQKYVLESGTSQPHKVVRVVKVTLQIVEGTMTRIDFEGAPTDSSTSNTLQCLSKIWEKSWENFKQITVSCQKVNGRLKRGTDKTLVGGLEEADASDPKYKLLAEESLQKYLTESGTSLPHKVDKVEKVTTQLVAGSMTRIDFVASPTVSSTSNTLQCHSEIWEKPWEHFKQITVSCQKANDRMKRGVPGGLEEVSASDPKYKLLAEESLQKYVLESGTSQPHKVVRVVKVTLQIVEGTMTRIDFEAAPTDSSTSNTLQCHSKIWEKSWENFKQITVSCQKANDRMKRGVPGGLEIESASDPKYKLLAEESLQKYILESGTSQPHKVVRVVKVTHQIVAGTMTRIDFEAAPTDSSTSNTLQCHSEIWEKSWENFKQITVSCQKVNGRLKRGTDKTLVGGLEEADASDPKYKLLAEESLQKYLTESGTSLPHKLDKVEKVTTQVVAGSMTRIDFVASPTDSSTSNTLQCHSEIWEKSWENFKQITVSCQKVNGRLKRGTDKTLVGGLEEADASDPKYKLLAEESLQKYLTESGTSLPHKVDKVEKVTTQLVAGSMTRIDFVASPTVSSTSNTLQCHSEIWEKPWEHFKQITVSCQKANDRMKRGVPGGLEEVSASDSKYKLLAEESLQKYVLESGTSQPHKVVRVVKVTLQIVEGTMTRIDFEGAPTDSSTSNTLQCHSKIWEKSWENFKQITVSCQKVNGRLKRGTDKTLVGGLEEADASDPKYKLLAEESLQKYLTESGTSLPHKVDKVEKVTTQLVAGSMTRIDFVASPTVSSTSNTLQCHSEIWEKPWEHFKQITVSCQKANDRMKRGVPGGLEEVSASDPKYKLLAEESLQKYVLESGTSQPHKVVRVVKVTLQIVEGTMTRIDFEAAPTDSSTSNTLQCHSKIWEKSWENFKQITVSCQKANDRIKRGVAGGLEVESASDPKYKLLAEESLQKYVLESGTSQPHKVVRVVKVTHQIVAGTMTRIVFEAAPTDSSTSNTLQCHSEIWEKSWENFKQITVSCQKVNGRLKRGTDKTLVGGLEEADASDPKYKLLAEESLQKYLTESGTSLPHKVDKVEKVTTQVVAGSMTRIDFVASPTDSSTSNTLQCHSEIWEKSWENFKQITVSCQKMNGRLKRGTDKTLVGGLEEADASDPMYKLLAEESLQKYLTESGTSLPHKVDKVEKVTIQVVAGSMTRIDFVASPTDSSTSNTLQCHSEIWEKPWEKFKQITVSCRKASDRMKRGVPGGLEEVSASDPKYKLLAEESLQKYVLESGTSQPHKVVRVVKVTHQIVAGTMTRIDFEAAPTVSSTSNTLQCHSEIWEKSWENFKQITVSCQKVNRRLKRGTDKTLVGGLEEADASDPKYKLLAEESLQKYLTESGTSLPHKVDKVEKVTTQLVAGSMTRIDFVASPTVSSTSNTLQCHSEIWEKPWEHFKQITVSCQKANDRMKRGVPGGLEEVSASDPKYKLLAEESLQKYVLESGTSQPHKVVKVVKVTLQIVEGTMTRIDFEAAPTDSSTSNTLQCHSKIWEKSWENFKQITVSCQKANDRMKRGVPGGFEVESASDPKYKLLAEESLQKYVLESGTSQPHKVVRVVKVTHQIVAGTMTRIDFEAAPTDSSTSNTLQCHSEIWEKPWEKFKQITVSCRKANDRMKRGVPGGLEEVSASDPKYKLLAEESLQKYVLESGTSQPHKVVRVVKVTHQIVAGTMTRIDFEAAPTVSSTSKTLQCHSEIWEKSWENFKQITVSCQKVNGRLKRGTDKTLVGGLEEADASDPKYKLLAEESLQKYLTESGTSQPHKVDKVEKVTTQLVAGSMTRIDFIASPTVSSTSNTLQCHSEIWEKPWEHFKQITVSCQKANDRMKRGVPGGLEEVSASDPKYKLLAEESLQKYVLESGTSQPHKVVRVVKVTLQIVEGTMTRIDFEAAPTDSSTSNTLQCHSKIWEKSWENFKQITVSCQKANDRMKRGVPGGLEVESASDPKYKLLAEESLQKYVLESGTSQPHKVVRVVKVTHQIVAGTMTRIDFEAAPTDSSTSNTLQCHSEIWEKPWEKFKQITVSCRKANDRMKRGVPGGLEEVSASDPKYKLLAEESLQKYVLESGTSQPHKVVRVVKVTHQIVAGPMTRIDFEAAPTVSSTSNTLQCHSEIWEKSWENFKQITVSCQKVNGRLKRGTDKTLVGGLEEADASDPKYKLLAEESLQKYLTESGTSQPHKVDKVEKVTTQLVAGSMTRIDFVASPTVSSTSNTLQCHSEIWEKSWENFKQITVSCQKVNGRLKRGTDKTLVGGLEEADASDPKYKLLAEESLQKYLTESGTSQPHKVDKVEKVTTQLVAGSMTRIDFVASPTVSSTSNTLQCHSEIWEKPWEHFKQITVSCQKANDRMKRGVPGGLEEVSASDPKYKLLAEESLQKYVLESGTSQPHKVVRVVKVTLQIVEGTMTRIDFEAAPTDSSTSNTLQCHSKIWEKSWENFKQITVSCQKANDRMKRGVPGGLEEVSASDPKYKLLAEESLQKYVLESGTSQPHKVVRVVKVTLQIVEGTMTRIDFEAAPTDSSTSNTLQCHSKIWEKSWENFKQITVSCQKANDRMKRGVPGGLEVESASDPKYKLLAEESLQKYVLESGTSQPHKVVRVVKVTHQIVAGTMTRIDFEAAPTDSSTSNTLQCHSEIWEKPWEKFKQITVSCRKANDRMKRGVPGGLEVESASDPKYKLLAEESLQKYVLESGTSQPHKVVRVVKVTHQIVAGTMTRIDFEAAPTVSSTSNTLQCHSEIWEKSWENFKQITVSCQKVNGRLKRGTDKTLVGGLEEADASDPKYKLLAEESLQKYLTESGTSQPHKVDKVEKVTTQLVAGSMTRIDFVASPTVSSTSNTLQCHSEIWEKPWEHFKQITVSCQKANDRMKRGVPGGLEEVSASDPKYKLLAEESLQKYVLESGTSQPHKVVRVVKVTLQIVEGTMTRIDFEGAPTDSSTSNTLQCHSEIWEKPWEKFKQITVSCRKANDRMKRGVPGGLEEVSASDPKYKLLAEESLQKYVLESGTSQPHKVVRVVKVTHQIVAGTMTRIDFEAAPTVSSTSNTLQCHSEIWEKSWENFKQITVSCQKVNGRLKRGTDITLVGGLEEADASDPMYKLLAEESLQKYLTESGTSLPHKVDKVEKVTTQVVAGSMTRIDFVASPTDSSTSNTLQCHSEIWEKPWEKFKQITVSCRKASDRMKRGVPGGLEEVSASDPKYKLLAEESLQKYVLESGTSQPHKVVRVVKVTHQIVAGTMTRIDFEAAPTVSSTSNTLQCHSEIWEKSWENFKQITVSCQKVNGRLKRGTDKTLVGGLEEADASDPKYKLLAEESLQKYLTESGTSQPHKVDKVEKVTTQLVAGSMTRIDFVASPTVSSTSNTLQCHSEIWEKPWEHFKQITVSCQKANDRMKRGVPGGLEEVSASDPKYKLLAEESLQKYVLESGTSQPHKVVRVVKVTLQIVEGTMTRIDFEAAPTDSSTSNTLQCHSEIWEKPWEKFKQITVSCRKANDRMKRGVPGGLEEVSASDPKYKLLAEESLQKYVLESGTSQPHKVVRVVKVTQQIVAGTMTRIDFEAAPTVSSTSNTLQCHSEIWEKSWENFKQITVSCQKVNGRLKRGTDKTLVGGLEEADASDPKYKLLAEESLQKYLTESGTSLPHKVDKVEKVTTQLVAGSMTRIDFVASPTVSSTSNTLQCHSEIWEKPWEHFKQITVSCQKANDRMKRGVPGGFKKAGTDKTLVGGLEEADASDPKYKRLAEESLQKYVTESGTSQPHKVDKVEKVTTQAVAGTLTRIDFVASSTDSSKGTLKCHSEIWEREWLKVKYIQISCFYDDLSNAGDKDPSDSKYFQLADESLRKYLIDTGMQELYKVSHVKKVNVQHTAGLNTRLTFIALPTDTSKSDILNCFSEILEQPQLDKKNIDVSCQYDNHRLQRQISGLTLQNPTEEKYLKLANDSLKKYLLEGGSREAFEVVRIDQVTTQISAGNIIRINFLVASGTNTIRNCLSEITEQPSPDKSNIHVVCDSDLDPRQKRALKQGNNFNRNNNEMEQDVSKPIYQLMAKEALDKFSRRKGILHKVFEVNHVTTRVVSGMIYEIDFTASPTECLFNVSSVRARSCKLIENSTLYCHTKIWDQPWIRRKKIDVSCNSLVEVDYDEYSETDNDDTVSESPGHENERDLLKQDQKVYSLAEQALTEFLSSTNRKYVFRIREIHSFNDYLADGLVSKLEFSIAPTLCLREGFTDTTKNCEFKNPIVEYNCNAKIVERAWLGDDKEIKVHCRKQNNTSEIQKRLKRQIGKNIDEDDNEIDEDTSNYYAERAVHHLNEHSDSNNLFKLITIHAVRNNMEIKIPVVKMFIEVAETYCLRQNRNFNTMNCEEMEGLNHRLCLANIYPSSDDDLVIKHVTVVCDDNDRQFNMATGLYIPELLRLSILELERNPEQPFKLVHQGEPQVIPSLSTRLPIRLNFIVATTNCSKNVDLSKNPFQCFLDTGVPSRTCTSLIWLNVETRTIINIDARCNPYVRRKRASLDAANVPVNDTELQKLVSATLEKLEMTSVHRYKQRILHINSYSSKITSGKVTTIDFDVAYTSCLKYEWIANITSCDFLEHLPRRHCVAQIWERLWIKNGMHIDVSCEDDETPLEAHIEFESAEMANQLAQEALKHIEAKYPHPKKQKVVRIFSLEKQVVAGVHYRMKLEVGLTDCAALSDQVDCKLNKATMNKFCRVNVWVRPWTDHPPNFRVSCDYQDGASIDLYRRIQSEQLFYNFLATYNPTYVNDHQELEKRFNIFKANVKKIHEFNVHEKGTAKYGVTRYADLSYEEFSSRYLGLKPSLHDSNQPALENAEIPEINLPLSFDWREFGAVTEVKDQGECGISWAFSVTGNIESQWKIKSERLISLSEQQLLDCDEVDKGCDGGLPTNAYRAIEDMGGLEADAEYMYEGEADKCTFNASRAKVRISGALNITANETDMAKWLVYNGPISIGLNGRALQFYTGGIAHPWSSFCDQDNLDHAALIVGYGVYDYPAYHKKIPYWIVKNSWGRAWGEQGYFLIHRGDGTCGVNKMATSSVIAN